MRSASTTEFIDVVRDDDERRLEVGPEREQVVLQILTDPRELERLTVHWMTGDPQDPACRQRSRALRRAMHEREQLFRAVFFDASDAILLIDDRRAIIDANPAAASLFGRVAERLVGETLDDLMAESVDTWRSLWRDLMELGEAKRQHQVSRVDGSRIVECIYRARIRAGTARSGFFESPRP